MVDGWGAPEEPSYQEAVSLLYSVAFTIKMSKRNGSQPEGYFDYVVPPLEGLWNCSEEGFIRIGAGGYGHPYCGSRNLSPARCSVGPWHRPPARSRSWITPECVWNLRRGALRSDAAHGPYSREQETVDTLAAFLEREGLVYDHGRRHHEIYLSDPRRCAPERLKTVLRLPVKRKIV